MTRPELGLIIIALVATVLYQCPYVGHWDAFEYARCMLEGRPSSLMLGRPLFIAIGWSIATGARELGWPAERIHEIVWLWVALCALAVPLASYRLFRELVDQRTAWWGALLLASSPAAAHASGMLMSEAPMMLVLLIGLTSWHVGLRLRSPRYWLAGCFWIGMAIGLREQAAMMVPWLALSWFSTPAPRPWMALAWAALLLSSVALAGPLWCWVYYPGYGEGLFAWYEAMAHQRQLHPIRLGENIAIWLRWVIACQPLALLALIGWRRFMRHGSAIAMGFLAWQLVLLLSLAGYQDLLYSPRYLLIATPGLALLAGAGAAAISEPTRLGAVFIIALSSSALLTGRYALAEEFASHRELAQLAQSLEQLPREVVVIVGQGSPLVDYLAAAERPGPRQTIGPGWGWPGPRLAGVIDEHLAAGRRLLLAPAPALWIGERMQADLDDLLVILRQYRISQYSKGWLEIGPRTP